METATKVWKEETNCPYLNMGIGATKLGAGAVLGFYLVRNLPRLTIALATVTGVGLLVDGDVRAKHAKVLSFTRGFQMAALAGALYLAIFGRSPFDVAKEIYGPPPPSSWFSPSTWPPALKYGLRTLGALKYGAFWKEMLLTDLRYTAALCVAIPLGISAGLAHEGGRPFIRTWLDVHR